jgi:calmodulin
MILSVSEDVRTLIPTAKLNSLAAEFAKLDVDRDGKIALREFGDFSLAQHQAALAKRFEAIDADRDGFIAFEEFAVASEPKFRILQEFRALDLDRNGLLSLEEAANIAEKLVLPLNTEQVRQIIEQADYDGDGQVTYYEYLGAIAEIGFQ